MFFLILENEAALRCCEELTGMRNMVTQVWSSLINHLLYWPADRMLLSSSKFSNLSLCGQTTPSWITEVYLNEWMPNSKAFFSISFSVGSVVNFFCCELILYICIASQLKYKKVCFLSALYLKKLHLHIKGGYSAT